MEELGKQTDGSFGVFEVDSELTTRGAAGLAREGTHQSCSPEFARERTDLICSSRLRRSFLSASHSTPTSTSACTWQPILQLKVHQQPRRRRDDGIGPSRHSIVGASGSIDSHIPCHVGSLSLSTCVPASRAPDLQFGVHLGSREPNSPIAHPAKPWKR